MTLRIYNEIDQLRAENQKLSDLIGGVMDYNELLLGVVASSGFAHEFLEHTLKLATKARSYEECLRYAHLALSLMEVMEDM